MHDEKTERFDPEVLRQLTSGDQEIMTVVISAFLSQYPEHLESLRAACLAGNSAQVLAPIDFLPRQRQTRSHRS